MSDAEKSAPCSVASSAEVDVPDGVDEAADGVNAPDGDGDPPHHDDGDVHKGPHHDESLAPYQRTLISAIAPSLLTNVPRPWPAFLCLVFLHVGLFVGAFIFTQANCQIVPRTRWSLGNSLASKTSASWAGMERKVS